LRGNGFGFVLGDKDTPKPEEKEEKEEKGS
jgi:hypothetical protein